MYFNASIFMKKGGEFRLLYKHIKRINAITAPAQDDCRNSLVGRTMHYCAEGLGRRLRVSLRMKLAQQALTYEQRGERMRDRRIIDRR